MADIIDINVAQTVEEVTINVVDNVIQVNINQVTGGGGTQDLNQTLVNGNATDGEDIFLSDGDAILLDNGSKLKKGTTNANNGGNNGIALKCSLDYEFKWEAGRMYIMQQDGIGIRETRYNFNVAPTVNDDNTKGYAIDSRWILDNGDLYICTDATEADAVWELQVSDNQTLQEVMELGSTYSQAIAGTNYDFGFSGGIGYMQVSSGLISSRSEYSVGRITNGADDGTNSKGAYDSKDISDGYEINVYDDTGGFNRGNRLLIPFKTSGTGVADFTVQNNLPAGTYELATLDDIPSITGLVPYTGATTNVDLGEFELKAGQIELDTTPTGTAGVAVTRWNDTIGSSETTLKGGSVVLKNGVDLVARVVNKVTPNTTLTKAAYQVVRISGAQGQRLAVNLAQANNDNNSADTLGIVTETIATNQEGFIMTVGQLEGINTTGSLQGETWADGDVLYLSPTTAGRITNIKPTGATGHIVMLGYVEYAHAVNGKIYVKIMNGWELDELHNVFIDTPLNNQALTYESSTDLWKNRTIIEDSITDGVTTIAPSQNAVFDALALKQNALVYRPYRFLQTSQTAHTGTIAETIIASATISANTFNSNDVMKLFYKVTKPVTTSGLTCLVKINTTNTLSGATLISAFTMSTTQRYALIERTFDLQGGNLFGQSFSSGSASDVVIGTTVGGSTAYNTANTLFVFFTIQLANTGDSATPNLCNITN
jgi:nitrogen fixation protein